MTLGAQITARDVVGRRVGRNWWREWNVDLFRSADHAWWLLREAVACGYETEMREFEAEHPRPTLRGFLEANAGCRSGAEWAA